MTRTPTRQLRPEPPEGIGFWGGPFSSFNGGPFVYEPAIQWPESVWLPPVVELKRAEHGFQAAKATSPDDARWILAAETPQSAKARGSRRGECQPDGTWRKITLRDDWEQIKFDVMYRVHRTKYRALPRYREALLATGDAFLYENSPHDNIWGLWDRRTGTWTGQNLLGKVLMQIRSELRS